MSETDVELRRLREKIDGLNVAANILLERIQPVTRQTPPRTEVKSDEAKASAPESPIGNELAAASREIVSVTMRLRERIELLAI